MKLQILSVIAVVLFLSKGAAHANEATEAQAKDVKSLQGEWQLESIEVNGENKMADEIQKRFIRLEFKGDEWINTKS